MHCLCYPCYYIVFTIIIWCNTIGNIFHYLSSTISLSENILFNNWWHISISSLSSDVNSFKHCSSVIFKRSSGLRHSRNAGKRVLFVKPVRILNNCSLKNIIIYKLILKTNILILCKLHLIIRIVLLLYL